MLRKKIMGSAHKIILLTLKCFNCFVVIKWLAHSSEDILLAERAIFLRSINLLKNIFFSMYFDVSKFRNAG